MPNKHYQKGANSERDFVNKARAEGKISYRSAGSHSLIDFTSIDPKTKIIEVAQIKNIKRLCLSELQEYKPLFLLRDEFFLVPKVIIKVKRGEFKSFISFEELEQWFEARKTQKKEDRRLRRLKKLKSKSLHYEKSPSFLLPFSSSCDLKTKNTRKS